MQRFSIYHKSKSFHPTTNQVLYSFNLLVLSIWIFLEKIVKTEQFTSVLGWLVAISWTLAVFAMLVGAIKAPPLRGRLDGFISFEKDKITVDKEVFNLINIKKIKITNDDYYGKIKTLGRGNFNSSFSNGVDNEILIELHSAQVKVYNFEIYNSADFQKVKPELISYYLEGKLEFYNLTNLLGYEKTDEISDFKDYCKNTVIKSGLAQ